MTDDYSAWIGRETLSEERLQAGLVAGLLATLDRGEAPHPGDPAPAGAHWLLSPARAPMSELGPDGHVRRGDFLPPIPATRRMWASSEIAFAAPIPVDAPCRRRSRVESVTMREGRQGPLWLVTLAHHLSVGGRTAVEERQTIVYLDGKPQASGDAGQARLDDWPARRTLMPGPVLLFRYSALTFNAHRIHYDLPYATEIEGYPGLVVQGPLIATLLLDLCRERFGAEIRRFRFRARAPAFAERPLHLVAREVEGGVELAAVGPEGRLLTTAFAELHPGEGQAP